MGSRSASARSTGSNAVVEACTLGLALLVPLHFELFSERAFEPPKVAMVRAAALAIAVAGSVELAQKWRRVRCNGLGAALLAWLAVQAFSTALSPQPLAALFGGVRHGGFVTELAYVTLFFGVAGALRTSAQLQRLVSVLVYGSAPVALYTLGQAAGADPIAWGEAPFGPAARTGSTLGNPIFLAAYLGMIAFPTGARALEAARDAAARREDPLLHARTVSFGLLLTLQFAAVALSLSRGPMLGILVGVLTVAIVVARRKTGRRRRQLRELAGAGCTALGGASLGGLLLLAPSTVATGGEFGWAALAAAVALTCSLTGTRIGRPLRSVWPLWLCVAAVSLLGGLALDARGPTAIQAAPALALEGEEEEGPELLARARQRISHTRSVDVRLFLWRGYRDAFFADEPAQTTPRHPHAPARADRWHALRPWIGYGRAQGDALYLRHLPAEAASLHGPTETADRAHNVAWDVLVSNGVLGLVTWLALLLALAQTGLAAIGYSVSRRARRALAVTLFGSTAAGAWIFVAAGDSSLLGPGLQVGWIAGLLAYLALGQRAAGGQRRPVALPLAVFAAVIGHLSETLFSFPVAATSLCFWLYAAIWTRAARCPRVVKGLRDDSGSSPVYGVAVGVALGALVLDFLGDFPVVGFDSQGALRVGPAVSGGALVFLVEGLGGHALGVRPQAALFFGLGMLGLTGLWTSFGLAAEPAVGASFAIRWRRVAGIATLLALAALAIAVVRHLATTLAAPTLVTDDLERAGQAVVAAHRVVALRPLVSFTWFALGVAGLAGCLERSTRVHSERTPATRRIAAAGAFIAALLVGGSCQRPIQADVWMRSASLWRRPGPSARLHGVEFGAQLRRVASSALAAEGVRLASRDLGHLLTQANLAASAGRFDVARLALEQARAVRPIHPVLLLAFARMALHERSRARDPLVAHDRRTEALAWYELAEEAFAGHPDVRDEVLEVRFPPGRERTRTARSASEAEVNLEEALQSFARGDFEEALRAASKAAVMAPWDGRVWELIARLYAEDGNAAAFERALNRTARWPPDHATALRVERSLAQLYRETNRPDAEKRSLARAETLARFVGAE